MKKSVIFLAVLMIATVGFVSCENENLDNEKPVVQIVSPVEDEMVLYVWDKETYEKNDTLIFHNAMPYSMTNNEGSDWYIGQMMNCAPKNFNDTIYACAKYTSGGIDYNTPVIAYSAATYLKERIDANSPMKDLAIATVLYGYHADAYFNK